MENTTLIRFIPSLGLDQTDTEAVVVVDIVDKVDIIVATTDIVKHTQGTSGEVEKEDSAS